jgi:nucleotide-binding universal stress UspA family protein
VSSPPAPTPFVHSVFHPSDFSAASERAFAHALAIALVGRTELTILHAADEEAGGWRQFPAVRATLERWGLLAPGSPRSAVFEELALRVSKVSVRGRDPAEAVLAFVQDHPTDLIVLATEGRDGVQRWLRPSVAQSVAHRSRTLTLFVPEEARGFVDPKDGRISLRRIAVAVDRRPDPQPAIVYATRAAAALGDWPVEITLLHVDDGSGLPALELPEDRGWSFRRDERSGDPVDQILRGAAELDADLLVLATEGRQGVLDALRGSVTERVVRNVACPVLAVPA